MKGTYTGKEETVYTQKAGIAPLESGISAEDVERRSYLSYVQECADLLMEYGTDRYGEKHQPLLVTILDVRTRTCPEHPPLSAPTPYAKPTFFRYTAPAKPHSIPTPYASVSPDCERDEAWGNHKAYEWKPVETYHRYEVFKNEINRVDFTKVKALSLCIEVDLQLGFGAGIAALKVNDQPVAAARTAGSYWIAGSEHHNATYAAQTLPRRDTRVEDADADRQAFLSRFKDKLTTLSADPVADEQIPVFMWERRTSAGPKPLYIRDTDEDTVGEAENGVALSSTREWLMCEFDEPVEVSSVEVFWMDDNKAYRVPASWRLLYADSMDPTRVEYPPFPVVPWRGEKRLLYWKPRSSDFYEDQPTYRALYQLAKITGDDNYADFATESLACAMSIVDSKGMFWWGGHRCYDVFTDEKVEPNYGYEQPHETAIKYPNWELLWQVDPEATHRELEGIWEWHINDKQTGEHDRHNFGESGAPFAMNGGLFLYSMAFLYAKTGDQTYLDRAELIADYHWQARNPETNLTPEVAQSAKHRAQAAGRTDLDKPSEINLCSHQVVGLHCYYLLKSYELIGVEKFRDYALTYLQAYASYAYDPQTGKFYGALHLRDGSPALLDQRLEGSSNIPYGYIDLWQPYQYGSEYPIYAAQSYAYAYGVTGDETMLDTARKWADFIRANPPENGCRTDTWYELYARLFSKYGTFAGHYGRAISFYVHLYAHTGDSIYLDDARKLGREAVSKLYYNGLFRGHPARPYYCAVDDVGQLLAGLIQLDRALASGDALVGRKAIPIGGESQDTIGFDNW